MEISYNLDPNKDNHKRKCKHFYEQYVSTSNFHAVTDYARHNAICVDHLNNAYHTKDIWPFALAQFITIDQPQRKIIVESYGQTLGQFLDNPHPYLKLCPPQETYLFWAGVIQICQDAINKLEVINLKCDELTVNSFTIGVTFCSKFFVTVKFKDYVELKRDLSGHSLEPLKKMYQQILDGAKNICQDEKGKKLLQTLEDQCKKFMDNPSVFRIVEETRSRENMYQFYLRGFSLAADIQRSGFYVSDFIFHQNVIEISWLHGTQRGHSSDPWERGNISNLKRIASNYENRMLPTDMYYASSALTLIKIHEMLFHYVRSNGEITKTDYDFFKRFAVFMSTWGFSLSSSYQIMDDYEQRTRAKRIINDPGFTEYRVACNPCEGVQYVTCGDKIVLAGAELDFTKYETKSKKERAEKHLKVIGLCHDGQSLNINDLKKCDDGNMPADDIAVVQKFDFVTREQNKINQKKPPVQAQPRKPEQSWNNIAHNIIPDARSTNAKDETRQRRQIIFLVIFLIVITLTLIPSIIFLSI